MKIACFIALILYVYAGAVVSNIPTIVTSNKSYISTNPQWLTSPYFRAGNQAVIQTLTGNDKTPTYTFTFSSALPGLPNLAYGIKNYRGNDWLGQEFYEIKKIGLTSGTFKVSIQIYGVTNLWLLTVAYLAMDPNFPHHLNTFDNVPINNTGGDIVNITAKSSTLTYYTNYINYTQQANGLKFSKFQMPLSSNNIVLFMTSFWIRGTFGSGSNFCPVQFHFYTGIINQSFYWWNATLFKQALVTNVHFSQIIFNTQDVQSSNQYFIVYKLWYNDLNGGFMEVPSAFVDNFIMGVTTFQTVDGYCGFQYQWQFANKTINGVSTFGVQVLYSWSLTGTCGFSWSESSMFYMQTWLCPDPFYFFNVTSGLCQTECGAYTYANTTIYVCEPCVNTLCYQCQFPDKNICTSCASYLFYELINNTCTCISGYFASNSACLPCSNGSSGCLLCTYNDGKNGTLNYNSALFTCTSCNNSINYFLSGRFCTLCTISKCLFCANLTACSVCMTNYTLSVTLTCVICNVVGCAYCSTTNSNNCGVCNATLGYYITASQGCTAKCGDGIIVSAVEQCDDNNTASYDGCSSTCTKETSFTCSGSPSVCYYASSPTFTLVNTIIQPIICDTITFTFQISPANAVFSQSYIVWNNFLTTPNASLFTLNTSMFKYSNGNLSVSYFMLATIQNTTLVFYTNYSTLIANSTIFANTISNTVTFTVLPTNNRTATMVCCTGYQFDSSNKTCIEICGDGILFLYACDDGNIKNGDGCSSICQVQPNYVCVNGSVNSSSVCYYNGSISVSVASAVKDPTSNSLTISYAISPIGPVLNSINGSYNFQPYITLSNPSATITSAVYNPATGNVDVQVSYNSSIQGQSLNLNFNPPATPQTALMPDVSNNWVVSPTNRMSATFYPTSTYQRVNKLTPYATVCLASYLSINAFTLFFRKFIGLELATLLQIGYLSILLNTQLPVELSAISLWKYVFGYNNYYISNLTKNTIDQPFALYGYQKYFGYSCNAMAVVILGLYGLSIVLILASTITTKTLSRKLKSAGIVVLSEVTFAVVLFCTPNILISFFIQIKQNTLFDTTVFWSTAFMVLSIVAMLASHIINIFNIEQSSEVGTFFRKHSQLGVYCSLFFSIRLILLTITIYIHQVIDIYAIYLLIAFQSLYLLFVAIGRPHKKPLDFARSILIEVSLLYVLATRLLYASTLKSDDQSGLVYFILVMIQLGAYGVSIVFSIISLIYHIVKKFRRNKIQPQEDKFKDQDNHQKIRNDSMAKLSPNKQLLHESSPSKRKVMENNSIVFDVQQIQGETYGSTGKSSEMKFDFRREQRKYKRRR